MLASVPALGVVETVGQLVSQEPVTPPCPATLPEAGPSPNATPVVVHGAKLASSKSCSTVPVGGV